MKCTSVFAASLALLLFAACGGSDEGRQLQGQSSAGAPAPSGEGGHEHAGDHGDHDGHEHAEDHGAHDGHEHAEDHGAHDGHEHAEDHAAHDDHEHAEDHIGDDGHEHAEDPLGTVEIGGLAVEFAQGHGGVVAGKEGHLVVKLPYSDSGATIVRAWIGTADRTLSLVGKGEYAPSHDDYDIHATAPAPLPESPLWWVEIERPDGAKVVGSVKPLME